MVWNGLCDLSIRLGLSEIFRTQFPSQYSTSMDYGHAMLLCRQPFELNYRTLFNIVGIQKESQFFFPKIFAVSVLKLLVVALISSLSIVWALDIYVKKKWNIVNYHFNRIYSSSVCAHSIYRRNFSFHILLLGSLRIQRHEGIHFIFLRMKCFHVN